MQSGCSSFAETFFEPDSQERREPRNGDHDGEERVDVPEEEALLEEFARGIVVGVRSDSPAAYGKIVRDGSTAGGSKPCQRATAPSHVSDRAAANGSVTKSNAAERKYSDPDAAETHDANGERSPGDWGDSKHAGRDKNSVGARANGNPTFGGSLVFELVIETNVNERDAEKFLAAAPFERLTGAEEARIGGRAGYFHADAALRVLAEVEHHSHADQVWNHRKGEGQGQCFVVMLPIAVSLQHDPERSPNDIVEQIDGRGFGGVFSFAGRVGKFDDHRPKAGDHAEQPDERDEKGFDSNGGGGFGDG